MVASKPAPARVATPSTRGFVLLAVLFALIQRRLYPILLPHAMLHSSQVTEGIVHGETAWRIFQSRVLGPYLIQALSAVTGSYTSAFDLFSALCIAVAGYFVLALTQRLRDKRRPPVAAFMLFQMTFVLLTISNWLYAWDLVAIAVFAVFNYLVLKRAGPKPFAWLYLVAIFNSEVAFFIAAWLILDPLLRRVLRKRDPGTLAPFEWKTSLLGAGLLAGGLALIEALRSALLVHETLPQSSLPENSFYGKSFHFTLAQNAQEMVNGLNIHAVGYPLLIPLFLLAAILLAVQLARIDRERCLALSVVTIGMVASFLCFGDIYESRVLMPLIPFVAMNGWQALMPPE